jgi:hypothetical protein
MSTPDETFRATWRGRPPESSPNTLIIMRQGLDRAGHAWLTFNGAIKTTVVLTDQEAGQLAGLLGEASRVPRSQ